MKAASRAQSILIAVVLVVIFIIVVAVEMRSSPRSSPPPPRWLHGRAYISLRNDARHICLWEDVERRVEAEGYPQPHALHEVTLWALKYDAEQVRLEQRGYETPSAGRMMTALCP